MSEQDETSQPNPDQVPVTSGAVVEASTGFHGHLQIRVIRHRRNKWWYKLYKFLTLPFFRSKK